MNNLEHIYSELYKKVKLRNFSTQTFNGYKSSLTALYLHFKRDLSTISKNDLEDYLLTLEPYPHHNTVAAVKFYFSNCLNSKKFNALQYPKLPEVIKPVPSEKEMKLLIDAATNVKHRTWIILAYTTGMRINESLNLKWDDIDMDKEHIIIRRGKGNKDRIVKLTKSMINQLLKYDRTSKGSDYIFSGQGKAKYSRSSVIKFLEKYAKKAGLNKHITPHVIRAAFITHLDNLGVKDSVIQQAVGHKSFKTTLGYMRRNTAEQIPDLI